MQTRLVISLAIAVAAFANFAYAGSGVYCDLSELPCATAGKCLIEIRNLTGLEAKTCNGQSRAKVSIATVATKAADGKTAGSRFQIAPGAKKSVDLVAAKRNETFLTLEARGQGYGAVPARLTCDEIRSVLSGDGKCKLYYLVGEFPDGERGYGLFD